MQNHSMKTREVPLTRGYVAIVDADDYEKVAAFSWQAKIDRSKHDGSIIRVYAHGRVGQYANGKPMMAKMHRVILGLTDSRIDCDHKNHDGLDNRRENLRVCTRSQNNHNRRPKRWKFKGVSPTYGGKRWRATIRANGKQMHLGAFRTIEEAAAAYDKAALRYFGEFAQTNGFYKKKGDRDE